MRGVSVPGLVALAGATLLLWTHLGYPLFIRLRGRRRQGRGARGPGPEPSLCILVAAHDAADDIVRKVRHTQILVDRRSSREAIIISDGSRDGTPALARSAAGARVRVLEVPRRIGKEACLGLALQRTSAELLVFTDVSTTLAPDAIEHLVAAFDAPDVGCVSGTDQAGTRGRPGSLEGLYVQLEMWMRRGEARAHSMISASGCLFAARRELCLPWLPDLTSDFAIPLRARRRGFRTVGAPGAVARYDLATDAAAEFARKVRTVAHGLAVVWHFRRLLNPFRDPFLAVQLVSHKLLRWLTPILLVMVYLGTLALAGSRSALLLAGAQTGFGALGLASLMAGWGRGPMLVRLPAYVLVVNAAILVGWCRFIRGDRFIAWDPSPRRSRASRPGVGLERRPTTAGIRRRP